MTSPFKYRVVGSAPKVTVYVSQILWSRLWKAVAWSGAWAATGYTCVHWFGFTPLSLVGTFVCLLLALAGLFVVNSSAGWNAVRFQPDTVTWREIRPFTFRIRSFPLITLRDLGFAFFSHGGPVLRMDVSGTWYLLAEEVDERKVVELVREMNQRGVVIPTDCGDKQSVAPKFWMLD